jgi:hypothetical protein
MTLYQFSDRYAVLDLFAAMPETAAGIQAGNIRGQFCRVIGELVVVIFDKKLREELNIC